MSSTTTCRRHVAGQDALAEHDDREQAVALGDVVRVPRRHPGPLGPHRHGELGDDKQEEDREAGIVRQQQPQQPRHLHDRDAQHEPVRGLPVLGVAARRPRPLGQHRDPHDDVADGAGEEVLAAERVVDAGGEDEHSRHLHEGEQPVGHVVGVVGRGEPGEVHPGPPDGEEHHQIAEQRVADLVVGDAVRQLGGDLRDRHHEGEVEQQLQRGGDPVLLVDRSAGHRHPPAQGVAAGCWWPCTDARTSASTWSTTDP